MFKYQFCRNIKLNVQLHSITLCYKPIGCESLLRSSRPDVFCKKGILRNFAKFTGKHLCQSLFLIKLQASGDCFWVNFRNLLAYSRGWLSTIWTLSFIFLQNWYWNIFMKLQKLWQNQHTFRGDPTTNKVAVPQACKLNKKRLQLMFFSVNISKFLKNTYFEEHMPTAVSCTSRTSLYPF